MSNRLHRAALVALTLVGALLAASASATANPQRHQATLTTDETAASCVQTARARTKVARAHRKFIPPGGRFNMKQHSGKSVWIIASQLAIPFVQSEVKGAQDAAKAVGMKAKVFDGKGNVTAWNTGVSSAVSQNADAIILLGPQPQVVSGPLRKAKAKGIAVVDVYSTGPKTPLFPGVSAHITSDYALSGREIADWILADSNCTSRTLKFNVPLYDVTQQQNDGFKNEYTRLCPKCKLRIANLSSTEQLSNILFTRTQAELQADPSINYIWGAWDVMIPSILSAVELKNAQDTIKVIGHDGIPENLDLVRSGRQAVDGALPTLELAGWMAVDQIGRVMSGVPAKGYLLPDRLVDAKNIPARDADIFPAFKNFRTIMKKLWGVSG